MTPEEKVERLADFITAFRREMRVDAVDAGNGVHFLRLTYKEGKRITQIGLDAEDARRLATLFAEWAERVGGAMPEGGDFADGSAGAAGNGDGGD